VSSPPVRTLLDRRSLALLATASLLAACAAPTPRTAPAAQTPVMVEAITQPALGVRDTAYEPPRPAPPLRLTDQDGRRFDLAGLAGSPVFVYFGYTHCPDVCPTTLADIRSGIRQAGVDAKVVFVTIDPDRDDPAAMKRYVDYYGAGYAGLTGTAAQIAEAASSWGVSYRKLPPESGPGYPMTHTSETYLLDARGRLRHHLFFGAGADLIARRLREVTAD
jgi:protein SCO1/2